MAIYLKIGKGTAGEEPYNFVRYMQDALTP